MKVWAIKARGYYSGGMAIVAADDAQTACRLANHAEGNVWHGRWQSIWNVDYLQPESVEELPLQAEVEGVLAHYEMGE